LIDVFVDGLNEALVEGENAFVGIIVGDIRKDGASDG
jgi:hypothetical protein